MKKIVFGLLTVLCFGCNQGPQDMHFGPGPGDDDTVDSLEECSSCGHTHQ